MVHPTSLAQEYIWQCFSDKFFSEETKITNSDWAAIRKSINHRPLNTETQAHRQFLINTIKKIETFAMKYPQISCVEEIKQLANLVEKVNNI